MHDINSINKSDTIEIVNFILNRMPNGIIILNKEEEIVYQNQQATKFLKRFPIPDEISTINKRIFDAIYRLKLQELFPGEIYIMKKLEGSPNNWLFRLSIYEGPSPLIVIFLIEEKISHKLDMNAIRQKYKLTRRENDILRRVLDGLKNTEISEEIEISEQTVKDHLSNIYMKLGVENRFALIRSLVSTPET